MAETKIDIRKAKLWGVGFLDNPSAESGGGELTEEEIAENIYDWWTSGKAYSVWYAEKFLQQKLDFKDEDKDKEIE